MEFFFVCGDGPPQRCCVHAHFLQTKRQYIKVEEQLLPSLHTPSYSISLLSMTSCDEIQTQIEDGFLSFRADLDPAVQMCAADSFHRHQAAKIRMAEWKSTHASKKDHLCMLAMLVVEAHRQNPSSVTRADVKRWLQRLEASESSTHVDEYTSLISEIAARRLFSGTSLATPIAE